MVPQIHRNFRERVFRESVLLHAYSRGSSQLHFYPVALQIYPVVTRSSPFMFVREIRERLVVIFCYAFVKPAIGRHQQHIIEVASTCTRQVGVRKAREDTIRIKITRNSIPPRDSHIRTQLHHPKRGHRPWVSIARAIGTYKRIYIVSKRLLCQFLSSYPLRSLLATQERENA